LVWIAAAEVGLSPVRSEVSPDGAIRWSGRAIRLSDGNAGPVTLVAFVGKPGRLPEATEAASQPAGAAWQAFRFRVEIEPQRGLP
jgi:hypothetical protein